MVKIVADVVKNCLQPLKALAISGRHLADAVDKDGVESGQVTTQLPSFPTFTHSVQPVFRRCSANSC
jgi:hypothetical protein